MENGSEDSGRGRYIAIEYINFQDLAFVMSVGDFLLVKIQLLPTELSFSSLFLCKNTSLEALLRY